MKAETHDGDVSLPIEDLESYDQHKNLIAVIMARFFLRYLNLLYRQFEGDLVLPIVLGLSRSDEAPRAHERSFH
jgi:hypothetical protein